MEAFAAVTSDVDIYRSAAELIEQPGLKGASVFAATRRRELRDLEDDEGVAAWSRIRGALLDLSDIRCEVDPVN